jgi:hypothetical protein
VSSRSAEARKGFFRRLIDRSSIDSTLYSGKVRHLSSLTRLFHSSPAERRATNAKRAKGDRDRRRSVTARRETRPIGERAGARKKKIVGDVFSRRDGDARKKTAFFFVRVEGKDTAVVKRHTDVLNTSEPLDS